MFTKYLAWPTHQHKAVVPTVVVSQATGICDRCPRQPDWAESTGAWFPLKFWWGPAANFKQITRFCLTWFVVIDSKGPRFPVSNRRQVLHTDFRCTNELSNANPLQDDLYFPEKRYGDKVIELSNSWCNKSSRSFNKTSCDISDKLWYFWHLWNGDLLSLRLCKINRIGQHIDVSHGNTDQAIDLISAVSNSSIRIMFGCVTNTSQVMHNLQDWFSLFGPPALLRQETQTAMRMAYSAKKECGKPDAVRTA